MTTGRARSCSMDAGQSRRVPWQARGLPATSNLPEDNVTPTQDPHHDRRWLILGVIAIAQLIVVLDVTIVNIALPSAQSALGFSDDARQWIITAYALAFGSLL